MLVWYDKAATRNRLCFYLLKCVQLVLAAAIPVFSLLPQIRGVQPIFVRHGGSVTDRSRRIPADVSIPATMDTVQSNSVHAAIRRGCSSEERCTRTELRRPAYEAVRFNGFARTPSGGDPSPCLTAAGPYLGKTLQTRMPREELFHSCITCCSTQPCSRAHGKALHNADSYLVPRVFIGIFG